MQASESIVTLREVHKSYQLGQTRVTALKNLSLDVKAGEFAAVVGTSGSGKSTLLNLIGGIDQADAGEVRILGKDWKAMSESERSAIRNRQVGFIFQSFNLIPTLNVEENVELPLLIQKEITPAERKKRVRELLEEVGLAEFLHHKPDTLSGGQRQRVAIARALVTHPTLVIADEPTANLDSETTATIIRLMRSLNQKNRTSFLFSTHDEKLMTQVDRILRMKDGRLQDV